MTSSGGGHIARTVQEPVLQVHQQVWYELA